MKADDWAKAETAASNCSQPSQKGGLEAFSCAVEAGVLHQTPAVLTFRGHTVLPHAVPALTHQML